MNLFANGSDELYRWFGSPGKAANVNTMKMRNKISIFLLLLIAMSIYTEMAQGSGFIPLAYKQGVIQSGRFAVYPVDVALGTLVSEGNFSQARAVIAQYEAEYQDADNANDGENKEFFYYTQEESLQLKSLFIEDPVGIDSLYCYAVVLYWKGYLLDEEGSYQQAAECLAEALSLCPVHMGIIRELCNAYLGLGDQNKAMYTILYSKEICILPLDYAWYYRRLGYIFYEIGDDTLARSCQLYSVWFEESEMAYNELAFLDRVMGRDVTSYQEDSAERRAMIYRAFQDLHNSSIMQNNDLNLAVDKRKMDILKQLAQDDITGIYSSAYSFFTNAGLVPSQA